MKHPQIPRGVAGIGGLEWNMAYKTIRPLRFGDCDPSGIAYFPSYLDIMVGVVEEFFANIGYSWSELNASGLATPTVKLDINFMNPGFHGDLLDFALVVRRVGRSSLDLEHQVARGGSILWTADQRLVLTSLDTHKSRTWPTNVHEALTEQQVPIVEGG